MNLAFHNNEKRPIKRANTIDIVIRIPGLIEFLVEGAAISVQTNSKNKLRTAVK